MEKINCDDEVINLADTEEDVQLDEEMREEIYAKFAKIVEEHIDKHHPELFFEALQLVIELGIHLGMDQQDFISCAEDAFGQIQNEHDNLDEDDDEEGEVESVVESKEKLN